MIAPPDPPSSQPSNVHYRADTVTASEDNCGFLIKLVYQSLNRMLDAEMAPLDLTAMQWRPLTLIERGRADTSAELLQLPCTYITRQHDDCVPEINNMSLPVGQTALSTL